MKEIKIWHLTDLHLDCGKLKLTKYPECDYVLITGDLASKLGGWGFIQDLLSKNYIVIFILGNHEYHSENRKGIKTYKEIEELWKRKSKEFENFHVLINDTIEFEGIRFIGSTLWTNLNNLDQETIDYFPEMRDSSKIYKSYYGSGYSRRGGRNISATDLYDLHKDSVDFIEKELQKEFNGLTVLGTHHAPLLESLDTRYKDSDSNGYYASDLSYLFEKYKITAAFHGHIHQSKHYFYKGSLITCNPRGYRMYNEVNADFDEGKVIKLKKEL
jgi:Icc-related predicted phosphoesterase